MVYRTMRFYLALRLVFRASQSLTFCLKGAFEHAVSVTNVFPQRLVDQRLIVAAASLVDLVAKPVQNVGVDADGDTRLAGGRLHDGSAFGVVEIMLFFAHKIFFLVLVGQFDESVYAT